MPVLVSMQKRVAEGVTKFLEGKKAETDLYNTYQEWYEDISDRMTDNVPLIYEEFILVKTSHREGLKDPCLLHHYDRKTKRFGEKHDGDFKIAKHEGGWLSEKHSVWILNPRQANNVLQMTNNENGEWVSTAPKSFQRNENRNTYTYYSMIALAMKAPGRFPNHQELRIMEGVKKFFELEDSKTNFFKTYEEWYQDLWMR